MPAKCPGQDTQFWTPNDLYEVPCPVCGAMVEFFKDDVMRRCGQCRHLFKNPRLDLACAQWCRYADQCVPQIRKALDSAEGESGTLKERILRAVREELGADIEQIRSAVALVDSARALLEGSEGVDSRVVVAAAALSPLAGDDPSFEPVLERMGFDADSIGRVGRILEALRTGSEPDDPEFTLVLRSTEEA